MEDKVVLVCRRRVYNTIQALPHARKMTRRHNPVLIPKSLIVAEGQAFLGVLLIPALYESLNVGGFAGEEVEPGVGDEGWFVLDFSFEDGGGVVVEDIGEDGD